MSKAKALVSLVLALALIFTLAACGEQPAEGPIRLEVNPEMLDEIVAEGANSRPREDENFTAMEIDVDTEACTADIKLFGVLDDDLAAVSNEYVRMMRELQESEGQ